MSKNNKSETQNLIQWEPELILKRQMLVFHVKTELDYEFEFDDTTIERYNRALMLISSEAEIADWWDECSDLDSEAFRESGICTGIAPRSDSRHYECHEVGVPVFGVTDLWICWTYWFGGGKHGEPELIDWMDGAYLLKASIVLQPTIVFSKFNAQ